MKESWARFTDAPRKVLVKNGAGSCPWSFANCIYFLASYIKERTTFTLVTKLACLIVSVHWELVYLRVTVVPIWPYVCKRGN